MQVLLVNPAGALSQWEVKLGSKLPPLGLASLAGYLRQEGISVEILDACSLGLNTQQVLDYIRKGRPAYVGITSTTVMISYAFVLAQEIKREFPDITTIVGGPHLSALPEETIERFSAFDIGVYGEGEKTLAEIVKKEGVDSSVKGVVYRDQGRIVLNIAREYVENLDDFPFPAYDLLPGYPHFYRPTPNNYSHLPVASVISSRGCPFKCTFCAQRVFGRKTRACSVQYLLNHIKYLQNEYGVREICFYDDIFLLSKNRLYDFIEKKEKAKMRFNWSCEGRIDQIELGMLKDMKKTGCWQINFGVESGSQKVLDYFNKKITLEQIRRTFMLMKQAGLRARAYLIIGCKAEDESTLEETRKLVLGAPINDIHISFFAPLPGSEAYKDIVGSTRIEDFEKINQYLVSYVPSALSERKLRDFMSRLYREFYLHPRRLFRYFLMLFNRNKTLHLIRSILGFAVLTFERKK